MRINGISGRPRVFLGALSTRTLGKINGASETAIVKVGVLKPVQMAEFITEQLM